MDNNKQSSKISHLDALAILIHLKDYAALDSYSFDYQLELREKLGLIIELIADAGGITELPVVSRYS